MGIINYKSHNSSPVRTNHGGFSIIELVTVLAGLAMLGSIAVTAFRSTLKDFEIDDAQAHLNSIAIECLKAHRDAINTKNQIGEPSSVDPNRLKRNKYKEHESNDCSFFEINPTEEKSKTHFTMGFGISNGKITKFGIKDADNTPDIITRCKLWAGEKNCIEAGSSYSDFFEHMDNVRIQQATCTLKLDEAIENNANPAGGGDFKTWDTSASKDCANKTLPGDASRDSYTSGCKTNGCTKNVKISDGKIVGVGNNAASQYQEYVKSSSKTECDLEIRDYLETGKPQPAEITFENCTDDDGTLIEVYVCNDSRVLNKEYYEACKINEQIRKCTIDMERIRTEEIGGPHIVGEGAGTNGEDLDGLPPCGDKVWVHNKVISYEDET